MAAPRVGVGVFVIDKRTNRFVMGVRTGSHGAGTLALPGGHLEHGETFEQCASREVKEETGLDIHDVQFCTATSSVFADSGKHYVTIFMTAVVTPREDGSEPYAQRMEPDKCEGWQWMTFDEMRKCQEMQPSALLTPSLSGKSAVVLFQPLVDLLDQRPEVCQRLQEMTLPLMKDSID